jgi:hypothetical protein
MSRMDDDEEDRFLLQQLAPANIVGVHHYCDGWCERCGFTNRCVVYASLAREPMLTADDPLLEHLKGRFDQVRTLVARRSTFSIEEAVKNIGEIELPIRRPLTASRRAATSGAGAIRYFARHARIRSS